MHYLPIIVAFLGVVAPVAAAADVRSLQRTVDTVVTEGGNTVDLPAISAFETFPNELEGAILKLGCAEGNFMSTYTATGGSVGGGEWIDGGGGMIGKVEYVEVGSTFNQKLFLTPGMCTNPILTIDLRGACQNDKTVVFDILRPVTTPGSADGRLIVQGGGCSSDLPVFVDYGAGVDGAAALGDLWQVVTLDFGAAGCTFLFGGEPTPVQFIIDSDTTEPRPGLCDIGMNGDPHVKTWSGKHFDYMGECDLVLLHAPDFDGHGKTLDIQVRTKIRYDYSFIESAAIRIGEDTLEVSSFGDFSLNDVEVSEFGFGEEASLLSGFPIYHTGPSPRQPYQHRFDVVMSPKENITFTTFKDLVAVHMSNGESHGFFKTDVSGIMGSFDGRMLGRDGVTDMSADTDAYGQEWQVREDEPMLFREASGPQHPAKCNLPSPTQPKRRRLGEKVIAKEAAEQACSRFFGVQFENCVYDVMAVGDLDMAQAGAY